MWSINKVAKVAKVDFDASTLHDQPDVAAKYQLPDDGSGDVKVGVCFSSFRNNLFMNVFLTLLVHHQKDLPP